MGCTRARNLAGRGRYKWRSGTRRADLHLERGRQRRMEGIRRNVAARRGLLEMLIVGAEGKPAKQRNRQPDRGAIAFGGDSSHRQGRALVLSVENASICAYRGRDRVR